jgi:putative ABC transport system ATP-binding protein
MQSGDIDLAAPEGAAEVESAVLALEGAAKLRGAPPQQFRLDVPRFRAAAGQFVAVVGESGCGKSTLLDMLALISRPDELGGFGIAAQGGQAADVAALWQSGDEAALSALRATRIGYVLQTGGLLPFLTVRQNAHLAVTLAGLAQDPVRLAQLAGRLGIESQLDKKPYQLSGGQRQRAAILRSLVHRPAIILADEPTAAVDKTRAVSIVADFREIARQEGTTVIMVTHDVGLVEGIADRRFGFRLGDLPAGGTLSTCLEVPA